MMASATEGFTVADEPQYALSPEHLEAELERSRASAARLIDSLAEKLRARPAMREATARISRAAQYVQDSSVKDIAARVNRLVCRRPLTLILVAAAAGFLTARALRHR